MLRRFFKKGLTDPLVAIFFRQGISAEKMALGISLGLILSIIPVFGSSTILCVSAIYLLRLNPAVVLLVSQFSYPLQFALYLLFIRAGEFIFNSAPLKISIKEIFRLFSEDLLKAIEILWWTTMHALVIWFIISIPVVIMSYSLLVKIFKNINLKSTGSK